MKKIDVAILGAGTAGLSARKEVARWTDNYRVFDGGDLGTTCARVGCMPSKAFIQLAHESRLETRELMERVRELRDRFVRATMKSYEGWSETHLVRAHGKILGPSTLEAGGETYEASRIIIATGSSPVIPDEWKKYQSYLWDSDHFFEASELPETVAIIGLGAIGLELGQALSRLGIKVYGIDESKSLGGLTDPELIDAAVETFGKDLDLDFSSVESFSDTGSQLEIRTKTRSITVDKVLVAIGRAPNLSKLNLECLGLPLNKKGLPPMDEKTLKVPGTSIFIAGDANAERAILHEASDEGSIAGFEESGKEEFHRRTFLAITFSEPGIALVGKSQKALKDEKIDFVEGKECFKGQGRAIILGKEEGLIKVFGDPKTGQILGGEILAPRGEHLAHLLSWVVQLKLTVTEVLRLPFYHPTLEEGLRTALRDLEGKIRLERSSFDVARCWDHPTCES